VGRVSGRDGNKEVHLVMTLRQIIDRVLGRDGRTEADVNTDPARVDSGHGPRVGRVAGDDDFS
jgi:hypothetical protein